MKVKGILAFDLDGTLTQRNTMEIRPNNLSNLFNEISSLGYPSILVTGKPVAYAQRIVSQNNLKQKAVIAENASVYSLGLGLPTEVFGPNVDKIHKLKTLLGMSKDARGKQCISIAGKTCEVIVDPDDVSILTLFTNAEAVAHRWIFNPKINTQDIYEGICKIVNENDLDNYLSVLTPFPDGGIQVVRRDTDGQVVNKSYLPVVASKVFGLSSIVPIAMFGDGHNDIPAMGASGVIPISFNNAEESVKNFVNGKGGYVSIYNAPDGLGVVDGIVWLIKKSFFEECSASVESIIQREFADIHLNV